MHIRSTQEKIYNILKHFCFYLGFFSIGASIYLWLLGDQYMDIYVLKLSSQQTAIWIGLWAPTSFILSMLFDRFIDKIKQRRK